MAIAMTRNANHEVKDEYMAIGKDKTLVSKYYYELIWKKLY